jgi:hypothetical protein
MIPENKICIPSNILKDEEENLKFVFVPIEDPAHYENIFTKENYATLEKWGLIQNMELMKFRFNMSLDLKDLDKFVKELFNDLNVRKYFKPLESVFIMLDGKNSVENVKYTKLTTKCTNMDLFNTLFENNICTGESGYIQKDFEDYLEGILIGDKLKQSLLLEDSENYCIFNEEARNEFLFHIFKRISIGGSLCQYDDYIGEYLNLTKLIYKGIINYEFLNIRSSHC